MKILLVDGTIFGRKTGVLLEQVQQYIQAFNPSLELEILYFSKLQHQILDGSPLNDDMKKMIQKFEEADAYIFASPIFQASIIGNGGTYQHHLVLENQLRPILDYFRCLVTPNYVYTHADHFDKENKIIDEDVHNRLRELARVFVQYCEMTKTLSKQAVDMQ